MAEHLIDAHSVFPNLEGQHEVFNFDTPGSEFECAIERKEYVPGESVLSSMTLTRKRQGKPDDTVSLWLKTEWLDVIADAIKTSTPGWTAAEFSIHLEICEHDIQAIREGNNPEMLKPRMDSLFVNLKIAYGLGYQTGEEKERYRDAKFSFFALQNEHHIFYSDDDM